MTAVNTLSVQISPREGTTPVIASLVSLEMENGALVSKLFLSTI
jgi:hypothetical protein